MIYNIPRVVIAGISGSSGKTLFSLGLTRILTKKGFQISPFKKGPDYIDSAWLSLASHHFTFCLDPFFLSPVQLRSHFITHSYKSDFSIIEGNRGIFDGMDVEGSCSTAQLAKTLDSAVILVLNAAKMTRTAAALVEGIKNFDKTLKIAGVILNNTASFRHATSLQASIEKYSTIPVVGIIPRLRNNPIPERHLGLSFTENKNAEELLNRLADTIEKHIDINAIIKILKTATALEGNFDVPKKQEMSPKPTIGFIYDEAIWFYYKENLSALRDSGANLIKLSILDNNPWPNLDGLYIGGGFPELFADQLSHSPHFQDIQFLSKKGIPIYAECGGLILLAHALSYSKMTHNMADILPLEIVFHNVPQALGYTQIETIRENPFHPIHSIWKAHEFHYAECLFNKDYRPLGCLQMKRGNGMFSKDKNSYDGLLINKTFGCWNHLFAPAVPHWAPRFVKAALEK